MSEKHAGLSYEDEVDVIGTVTMARVAPLRTAVALEDGRELEAALRPKDETAIIAALKGHATTKVRVRGRGTFSARGDLERIDAVDDVTLLPNDPPETSAERTDGDARPIWEVFDTIMAEVPEDELAKLDPDAAAQLDHYVYGTEKR